MRTSTRLGIVVLCCLLNTAPALPAGADLQVENEIITNAIDERDYRVLTLANGMRALLISDPDSDLAAAALNVNVGYYSNPQDRAGLSHFLEHMLFLGTEKYPKSYAWREFVTRHGGGLNAFVSAENTVYYFEIDRDRLDQALDRFSQFFIDPLFSEEYVQRERHAVDSEYRMGFREDGRRLRDVYKETVNPEHPFAKFQVGDLDSLADRDGAPIRDAVIEFYEQHYSAELMTLAVVGPESLDRLAASVQQHMGPIRNTGAGPVEVEVPLFDPESGPLRLDVIPLRDTRELRFDFPFAWKDRYYLDKPQNMISHLIGHEGNGSLHKLLTDKGWISHLSAGGRRIASNEGLFTVSMELTPAGIEHIGEIGNYLFEYIALTRHEGIKSRIHEELARINRLDFEFRESADPSGEVISLADNLQKYPAELVLFGPHVLGDYDEEQIRAVLDALRPDNLRLTVMAPGQPTDRTSRYYNTDYSVRPIPETTLARWTGREPDPALAIPAPNIYLPDETTVRKSEDSRPENIPALLIDERGLDFWHLQDREFEVPKADLFVTIETKRGAKSVREQVMTVLYLALVREALNADAYPARIAGLSYHLNNRLRGIGIEISGYDDKQSLLLDLIVDTLLDIEVDPERFRIQRDLLIRQWDNSRMARPYQQLYRDLLTLLHGGRWTPEQRIEAIEDVTPEQLEAFIPRLLASIRLEVLSHGNLTDDEAAAIGRGLEKRIFADNRRGGRVLRDVTRLKPGGDYLRTLDIEHGDSALVVHYQAAEVDDESAAGAMLLEQIVKGPFFETLRTDEQLGYVVFTHAGFSLRVPGLSFVIQSPVASPALLFEYVEDFVRRFRERLATMGEADFDSHRQGLLTMLRESDANLGIRSQRLQENLSLRYLSFDRRARIADAVEDIDRNELLAIYDAWMLSDERRRIVIESAGNEHKEQAIDRRKKRLEPVTDIDAFRDKMPRFSM